MMAAVWVCIGDNRRDFANITNSPYLCGPKATGLGVTADMAKLVDVPDLGSGAARRVGSSPSIRTLKLFFWPSALRLGVYFYY